MREDLAAMGQPLNESDFYAIILGSLPMSYNPYISAINTTSSVLGKTRQKNTNAAIRRTNPVKRRRMPPFTLMNLRRMGREV